MFNVKTEMMTLAKWQIVKNIEEIFKTVFTLLKSVPCKKKTIKKIAQRIYCASRNALCDIKA